MEHVGHGSGKLFKSSREKGGRLTNGLKTTLCQVANIINKGIIIVDRLGRVTFSNRDAEAIFCGPQKSLIGRQLIDILAGPENQARGLVGDKFKDAIENTLHGVVAGKGFELVFFCPNGQAKDLSLNAGSIFSNGEIVGAAVTVEDITDEKREAALGKTLITIMTAFVERVDYPNLFAQMLQSAAFALGADSAMLIIRQGSRFLLESAYGLKGMRTPVDLGQVYPYGDTVAGSTLPFFIPDLNRDPVIPRPVGAATVPAAAFMHLPLIRTGRNLGAICFNFRSPGDFKGAQTDFAIKLAAAVTLAIENREFRRERKDMTKALKEALLSPRQLKGLDFG